MIGDEDLFDPVIAVGGMVSGTISPCAQKSSSHGAIGTYSESTVI